VILRFQEGTSAQKADGKQEPTAAPFEFNLEVSPTNATVMQGNNVTVSIVVNYLQGSPENVTLKTIGVLAGASCIFDQERGAPTNISAFNSALQILVSRESNQLYNITIKAMSEGGKTQSASFTLSVVNFEISVSGTVDTAPYVPTQIIFDQLSADFLSTTATFIAPVQSGNYVVTLPNQHWYDVTVVYETSDRSSKTHQFMFPFHVDTGVGVTSIKPPLSSFSVEFP
jgi:hypothetical protein